MVTITGLSIGGCGADGLGKKIGSDGLGLLGAAVGLLFTGRGVSRVGVDIPKTRLKNLLLKLEIRRDRRKLKKLETSLELLMVGAGGVAGRLGAVGLIVAVGVVLIGGLTVTVSIVVLRGSGALEVGKECAARCVLAGMVKEVLVLLLGLKRTLFSPGVTRKSKTSCSRKSCADASKEKMLAAIKNRNLMRTPTKMRADLWLRGMITEKG